MDEMDENVQVKDPTPGEILLSARENQGLTLEEVSRKLNLRPSLIRDIELNRFNQPNMMKTFIRGYMKSYAALVHVDEKSVLSAFDKMMKVSEESQQEILDRQERERRRVARVNLIWSTSVVTLIILGLLLVVYVIYRILVPSEEGTTAQQVRSGEPVQIGVRLSEYNEAAPPEFPDPEVVPVPAEELPVPAADDTTLTADAVVNRPDEIRQMEFEALQAQYRAGRKPSLADVSTPAVKPAPDPRNDARAAQEQRALEEARAREEAESRLKAEEQERKLREEASARAEESRKKAEAERRQAEEQQIRQREEEMRRLAAERMATDLADAQEDGTGEIDIAGHVQKLQDQHNQQRQNAFAASLEAGGQDDGDDGLPVASDGSGEIQLSAGSPETSPASARSANGAPPAPPAPAPAPASPQTAAAAPASEPAPAGQGSAGAGEAVPVGDLIPVAEIKKNAAGRAVLSAGSHEIRIVFSGDCWTGISAGGKSLLNRTYAAGGEASLTLEALPAKIVLGAPQTAQVYIDGRKVDLAGARSGSPYRVELTEQQ